MPWRVKKGETPNPYHVAVSEFMLQQTTVATVIPYFQRFIKRWPTLKALAAAELDDVRSQWAGLGYYRRANFLHRMANAVMADHAGTLPRTENDLRSLPGLGPYAAAAIAAISFDERVAVVDGNVERVVARLFMLGETGVALRKAVHERVSAMLPRLRAGDFAQSMMELGALVCTPRAPKCPSCPWQKNCMAKAAGMAENFPRKIQKKTAPEKQTAIYVLQDKTGRVLLKRRPETGLLAGLWEFPSTPWETKAPANGTAFAPRVKGGKITWRQLKKPVIHVFSHFRLTLAVQVGALRASHNGTIILPHDSSYRWMKREELSTIALPTVMRRVADAAFADEAV